MEFLGGMRPGLLGPTRLATQTVAEKGKPWWVERLSFASGRLKNRATWYKKRLDHPVLAW